MCETMGSIPKTDKKERELALCQEVVD
jgi:hypothetical protein